MANSATKRIPEPAQDQKFCDRCRFEYPGNLEKCPEDGTVLRNLQDDPLIGKVFAERYEIQSVLGFGGMSMVYKARHMLMDRIVAIKILHPDYTKEPTALQRFQQESKAAASLTHQNVVTVYDFGCYETQAFFVMDCLEGKSLDQTIEEGGPLPAARAVQIFKQVCDGLEAAHRKGIIHRDLKPGNLILLPQEGGHELVKIVDFGIAKMLPREGEQGLRLTQTGEVFGSPVFMSPEQCLGRPLDTRSDIYSLGCVMYETLVGEPPLIGDNFLETLNKHVGEKPKTFAQVIPKKSVPRALEAAIFKCLEKEPDQRFQTVGQLRDELSSIVPLEGDEEGGQRSTQARTQPKQVITIQLKADSKVLSWISGIALLLLFSLGSFLFLWPGPKDDSGTPATKLMWQVSVSYAESSLNSGDYNSARRLVEFAEDRAKTFGDNQIRLLFTLNLKAKILRALNQFDALKDVNATIENILSQRTTTDYVSTMQYLNSITTASDSFKRSLDAVDIQSSIDRVFRTSGELETINDYPRQEILLSTARSVYQQLDIKDVQSRAKLDLELADCLTHRQHLREVRPLLAEANDLYKKSKLADSEEALRALLELGIFDKDQSNYAAAKPELQEALDRAKKNNYSRLLAACYGAYSDYYHQLHNEVLAKQYAQQADKLH